MSSMAHHCHDCTPTYVRRSLSDVSFPTLLLSSASFATTWIAVAVLAQRRLFPALTGGLDRKSRPDELPVFSRSVFQPATSIWRERLRQVSSWRERLRQVSSWRLAQLVFSASIGLSAVLVELLLCEISNTFDPAVRGLALRITLDSLLILIAIVTPALEIHSIVKRLLGIPADPTSTRRTRPKLRLCLSLLLFSSWLSVVWYIPQASILRNTPRQSSQDWPASGEQGFAAACVERVGIIGISLMASLAGFAAVSSLWQTFGIRYRDVKESDLARKSVGLAATEEMLATKQSRDRALQRKISDGNAQGDQQGLVGRVFTSFRGSNEAQELQALRMEISGLETMRFTLSTSLSNLQNRRREQERSKTTVGRVCNVANLVFAIYCAYRICATSLSSIRRWWNPSHSFATSDPINNILALLTTHWDSELDRAAWSRQFSFLLSGIMLLASFNAVLQTFRLFARFAPGLLRHAQTSLPLIISQIAGTYVISSALLLRSNVPAEVSGVITEALGAPLDGRFVEHWFENWFLVAVGLTATGILVGRKVSSSGHDDDWDDDDDDDHHHGGGILEFGKRS